MLSTDELSGGDKFDLSVAMMSAAVHDTASVEKMSTLTRGWCFTANFVEWAPAIRDEFYRRMGLEVFGLRRGDARQRRGAAQAVRGAGYDPLVKYVPYDWSDDRSPAEAAEYLIKPRAAMLVTPRSWLARERSRRSLRTKTAFSSTVSAPASHGYTGIRRPNMDIHDLLKPPATCMGISAPALPLAYRQPRRRAGRFTASRAAR